MRIGILGGGQLGRMLALAGHPLGLPCTVLDPSADACAAAVASHVRAGFDDVAGLDRLAESCARITFEFENVPASSVARLAGQRPVWPDARALDAAQDRLNEKTLFNRLGLATAPFRAVDTRADLDRAVAELGLPAVLKTRRFGYDGKGQAVLREAADIARAWEALQGQALILEGYVAFDREVSLIAARGPDGALACYPLSENRHRGGILSRADCRPGDPLQAQAEAHARRILDDLGYVGVLAIEFFACGERLLGNEMAPRVHNSGHWTLDGCVTSQFENHLRAVAGLPLGPTTPLGARVAMVNFVGRMPPAAAVLALPGVHLHDYGKAPRPGRKVGHATLVAPDAGTFSSLMSELERLADDAWQA